MAVDIPPKPAIITRADLLDFTNTRRLARLVRPATSAKRSTFPLPLFVPSSSLSPTYTFEGTFEANSGLASWSISSVDIGTEDNNRSVIVLVHSWDSGASGPTLTSLTVNGVSMTVLATQVHNATNNAEVAIAIGTVTAGTSVTVSGVWTNAQADTMIGVYTATNLSSETPVDSAASTDESPTLDVNTSDDGCVIAGGTANSNPGFAWSGATEDYALNFYSSTIDGAGAHAFNVSAETPRAVSLTHSGNPVQNPSIAYSFR